MIVDSAINIGLAIGVDRRILNADDTQVQIPSIIMPTLPAMQPTQPFSGAAEILTASTIVSGSSTVTNQAQADTQIITVAKGLWELQFIVNGFFNYATAGGLVVGAALKWTYLGAPIRSFYQRFAAIGTFVDVFTLRYLFQSNAILTMTQGITGVGQTADLIVNLNAIRLL
jgi:hypothetical protein